MPGQGLSHEPGREGSREPMPLPCSFAYFKPASLREALDLLEVWGERARLLAGGTDLILAIKRERVRPEAIIDIAELPELHVLVREDGYLRLGAGLTFAAICSSPTIRRFLPALAEAAGQVGSPQIRNRGTLGGNIVTASPAGDTRPPLSVYGGKAVLEGLAGPRRVNLDDLLTGRPQEIIRPNEILREIEVPLPEEPAVGLFVKLGRRNALSIARLSVALTITFSGGDPLVKSAGLAVGAIAPHPVRLREAEETLRGRKLTPEVAAEVASLAAATTARVLGERASAPYKRVAIRGVVLEAFQKLDEAMKARQP